MSAVDLVATSQHVHDVTHLVNHRLVPLCVGCVSPERDREPDLGFASQTIEACVSHAGSETIRELDFKASVEVWFTECNEGFFDPLTNLCPLRVVHTSPYHEALRL